MSIEEVARACRTVGFEGDALVTMIAIAGAESGWNAEATNDTRRFSELGEDGIWRDPNTGESLPPRTQPEYSVGAFQINLLAHRQVTEEEARDYERAAYVAYGISRRGTDFTPWSTFRTLAAGHVEAARAELQRLNNLPTPVPPPPRSVYLPVDLARGALVAAAELIDKPDTVYIEENGPEGLLLVAFLPRAVLNAEWAHVDLLDAPE